jgi:hypothetical protein
MKNRRFANQPWRSPPGRSLVQAEGRQTEHDEVTGVGHIRGGA